MWTNCKTKFEAFIHNDDVKRFHMVIQGKQKMVVMGHINFKEQALIKKQRASKKMNAIGGKFKDEKGVIIKSFCLLSKVVNVFEVLEITEA